MDFVRVGYFIPLNGPLNGHPPSIQYKEFPTKACLVGNTVNSWVKWANMGERHHRYVWGDGNSKQSGGGQASVSQSWTATS